MGSILQGIAPPKIEGEDQSQPTEGTRLYFLKTIPTLAHKDDDATSAYSTAYINRFLRYSGSGHADTIVTEGHPIYLRFYLSPGGAQLAFSKTHARIWGFWIDKPREEGAQVLMFEGMSTKGFAWVDRGDGEEVLMWNGDGGGVDAENVREWKGWLLRDTPPDKFKGNPRVFADFDAEEGSGCARVDFIRHFVED